MSFIRNKHASKHLSNIAILGCVVVFVLVTMFMLPSQSVQAATATLIPGAGSTTASGDGTDSANITDNGGTACTSVVCANEIDETVASNDGDTTYNTNDQAEITGSQFYQLTEVASNYSSMNSVSIDVVCKEVGSGNDDIILEAIIYASNESTILADDGAGGFVQLADFQNDNNCGSGSYSTISATSMTVNATNDSKSNWDGARLALRWSYTKNQGPDNQQIYVTAVDIDIDYDETVPPPTQVVFTTSARTVTAGACSGAGNIITIQLQDGGGTPRNPSGSTTIRITSGSGELTVFSDSSCASELTNGDISFTTSENTKSFYFEDTEKSEATHTFTAAKQSGPDTISNGNQTYTVNAASHTRLVITLPGQTFTDGSGNSGSPSNRTAGSSFTITDITATDAYFNVITAYSGAKTLVYSGPSNAPDTTNPSYTTSVSFTSGQATTTLTTTLYDAESTTITATDGGSYGYASNSVTVDPGAIQNYLVTEAASSFVAGVCQTGTIQARDDWNNSRTTDTTTVDMTDSGSAVNFYTTNSCGTGTSSYTMSSGTASMYYTSTDKQGNFTITATKTSDTPTGASGNVSVDPAAAAALLIRLPGQTFTDGTGISGGTNFTGLRSPNSTAGVSYTFDVKAVDAYNNLVDSGTNNYTGSKTISWGDSVAGNAPSTDTPTFPSTSIAFTNGEANSLTATYVNATTGRTIEADDTGTPVSGTASTSFTVQANTDADYAVAASTPQTAGVAFNVTVTARDQYENVMGALYTAPAGTYTWTTTAANAPDTTAPSIGTLAQGDFTAGVATKSVTLYKNESGVTFTAQEPSAGSQGTSSAITVDPGEISAHNLDSSVTGNPSVNTSTALVVTITLVDTWRNPISGVASGNISLSATGGPSITQPSSNTDASGQTTGELSWAVAGAQTVTVSISGVSLVQNDGTTADADGDLDDTLSVTVSLAPGSGRLQGGSTIRGGTTIQ